jgi:hypothetical protein
VTCQGPVLDSMAFEEDKQATKDTLLAPTDKRVDMYRNCPIEWKAALTNEQWNPNPYEIRPTVPAPPGPPVRFYGWRCRAQSR